MKVCIIYSNPTVDKFKNRHKEKLDFNLQFANKHINLKNKELEKKIVFVLGSLLYVQSAVNASGLDKIDVAGNTILGIARKIGYWCCILYCLVDIIKALMQGDSKSIAKIMMKYSLAFGALYIFPEILNLIRSMF